MKKLASLLLSAAMLLGLAACGGPASSTAASSEAASSEAASSAASSEAASSEAEAENTLSADGPVRIAGLKGPTTMGLVNLLPMQEDGSANLSYDLQLYGTADEIVPLLNSPGHFGAVLCAADAAGKSFRYQNSNSLDITNGEAVAFGQAVVLKYAEWFKTQGCDTFNIGADEFANDRYSTGGMGFAHLTETQQYHYFVDYVNSLADALEEMDYTVRAFNDGINYGGQSGVKNTIQVCYWTSGWGGYNVAPASRLASDGFTLINTNGEYYYVLGKDSSMTNGDISAYDFETFWSYNLHFLTILRPFGVLTQMKLIRKLYQFFMLFIVFNSVKQE